MCINKPYLWNRTSVIVWPYIYSLLGRRSQDLVKYFIIESEQRVNRGSKKQYRDSLKEDINNKEQFYLLVTFQQSACSTEHTFFCLSNASGKSLPFFPWPKTTKWFLFKGFFDVMCSLELCWSQTKMVASGKSISYEWKFCDDSNPSKKMIFSALKRTAIHGVKWHFSALLRKVRTFFH